MEPFSKALAVLTSDEAHAMFTKTFNVLQASTSSDAAAVLRGFYDKKNTTSDKASLISVGLQFDNGLTLFDIQQSSGSPHL